VLFPGAAEVAGEGAGEQELGVGGDDDPHPPVGLLGRADLRGREAEGALQGADGVLDVEPCEVGAPELVQGQGAGAGMPEPELAVRLAAVREPLDGDVDEGAAQDGQLAPAGEPAAVAVDLGVDAVPGLGPDGPVERGTGQRQGLVRLGGRRQRLLPPPAAPALACRREALRLQAVDLRPPVRGAAGGGRARRARPGRGRCRPGGGPGRARGSRPGRR
jgi:hypothetical protein